MTARHCLPELVISKFPLVKERAFHSSLSPATVTLEPFSTMDRYIGNVLGIYLANVYTYTYMYVHVSAQSQVNRQKCRN